MLECRPQQSLHLNGVHTRRNPVDQKKDLVARASQYTAKKSKPHSPFVEIDIGLFADQVGISSSNTFDLGQSEHDFTRALDIGVEETENVLNGPNEPASEVIRSHESRGD